MIEFIIFDFDGLLVDSEALYVEADKRFLLERGINDFSIIDRLFGMRCEEEFTIIKEEFDFKESIEELMDIRNKYMMEDFENGKLKIMPYVKETLDELKNKFKLSIGSSSKKDLLFKGLEIHNLINYFDFIVSGDDVEKGKPEPDIYLKVAKLNNINPENCIVIEDAPKGILAGNRAGMKTVAIPNEQTKKFDFSLADFVISDFSELKKILF